MLQGTAGGGGADQTGVGAYRYHLLQACVPTQQVDGLTPTPPTARGPWRAWLMEAAHVQGGQQRAGLGQRRCGREWEALVHPVPLSTAKNKENGEADKGRGRLSISLRGGAAEGGRGPCLTGPSPPGLGPASARGGRAMGCPSPSWARLCVSGGAGLRGGGGRHVGSGCNARGLGDPRGPDPDFPEGATSSRLLWGRGLAHDQGAPPWGLLPGPADQSLDSPWGSTPLLWRPCPRTVNWGQLDHSPQG